MGKLRYSSLAPTLKPQLRPDPESTRYKHYLEILDYMQDRDITPSSYIRAHLGSDHFSRQLIGEMAKAHLIRIPDGYNHSNARYRPRPYEIDTLGLKALARAGMLRKRPSDNDPFKHKYLRSVALHSFQRAPKEIDGLILHSQRMILAHELCSDEARNELHPEWFKIQGRTIRPDAPLFGFEYKGAFMFFHGLEADRGTERRNQPRDADYKRKTVARMVNDYAEYYRRGLFKSKFGFSQITFPIVTTADAGSIINVIKKEVPDKDIQKRFIVKELPDFLEDDELPPPTAHLVTDPWLRVDGPFNIFETLKRTAERKSDGHKQGTSIARQT
ncbi:hypothetical protein [Rhodoplanes sp. Z2-YC6860]|uniref:hypothetical protein n=1 Tax=Rhodoplanes sp. Z2-YC6860 TaxID=674703 RepID=UPI00078D0A79|nr:hypothetical protein [Rhodoplanes sp. Z2-YC6860]AMN44711.1 hypothetical protein RHPLAN_63020 [Rhodoplanes sp. Z2-YC6860]